jgi:hypothetical protein
MLNEVPEWAKERGLNEQSFELLEEIAINPDSKHKVLDKIEYGVACGILNALEYAQDKGLI